MKTVDDLIEKPHHKRLKLDRQFEIEVSREAQCTVAMVRHVYRLGLGDNPSPERRRAYHELQRRGKLP